MAAQSEATHNAVPEELGRVLGSRQFAESPRLSRFLTYIVEKTLAGESGELKEYTIGTAVFDRTGDFDPRLDTIVRVQASKLRSRLNDYYASEGSSNSVKIRLPRGSYIPAFEQGDPKAVAGTGPEAAPARAAAAPKWRIAAVLLAVGFAAGIVVAPRFSPRPEKKEAIRFVVAPPDGYRFRTVQQLAPDGRKFACAVLKQPEGGSAIYLHSLETGVGTILPGTEGGLFPHWSPDAKAVAFVKRGGLYRLDLGGGAEPLLIAQVDTTFGMAWNRNGVILIGGSPGPVRRFSVSGANLAAVTVTERPDVEHVYPFFLPDGDRFLFLARKETPGGSVLYAGSLDGKLKKRILETETRAVFVPGPPNDSFSGHILFVRGGDLVAQPFDARRLELTGAPRRIAGGIPVLPYGASTFSASATGVLAYTTASGMEGQFTWLDRSGKVVGKLGPEGEVGDPVISADGSRVAYDQADGSNRDIWTVEIASGKTIRITFDPEVDHVPVWSPDGARIAFESHRAPPGLYVAASGGGSNQSLLLAGGDGLSDWSPDGASLLFESMRTIPQPRAIWFLPFTGERKPRLWLRSASDLHRPVLSPNRKWVAYVSTEAGRSDVFVQAFDPGSAPGSGKWQISIAGGSQPVWRADGRELFYLSPENVLMSAAVHPGEVFQYDRPVPLFDTRVRVLRGPRNDYATRDGNRFLFRMPAQGGAAPPIHVVVNWPAALSN